MRWVDRLRSRKLRTNSGKPRGPEDYIAYAIGDIHGQFRALNRLMKRINRHYFAGKRQKKKLIFLGDYVDRDIGVGRVIEQLIKIDSRRDCIFLRGNHDQVLLDFLGNPSCGPLWAKIGGLYTLKDYGINVVHPNKPNFDWHDVHAKFSAAFPRTHKRFLENTQLMHVEGDFCFVHAGVDPNRPLSQQEAEDLLWIEQKFLSYRKPLDKVIIHGHTVADRPVIKRNRIGIDTGAYITNRLSAVGLWRRSIDFLHSK